jgi:hydrogenase maturation protease
VKEWEWQLLEDKLRVDQVEIAGVVVRVGDSVRLRPRNGGDVFDIALADQVATVEALEQDYEGKLHVCVVLDNDPGRDLGLLRQPGHRFFFHVEEVEPLPQNTQVQRIGAPQPRILVAGIGNIFMGDDAFGVEVVRRLSERTLPAEVRVGDFGIRGFDLAYALQDGYEATILIDACPRDAEPGTLYVVEPDMAAINAGPAGGNEVDAHGMDPVKILGLAVSMGGPLKRVLLVGCQPATLGPEEGLMGLSEPVARAVSGAVQMVETLVGRILAGEWPGTEQRTTN